MLRSDAMHFHFHDPELLFVARALKKRLGDEITITYDMHEHLPAAIKTKQWLPAFIRPSLSSLVERVEKNLMKYCDTVIFAELSYKENYTELSLNKVDVLNYPILPKVEITADKEPIFTLVYVGILIEQRGLFNMLHLAKALREKQTAPFCLKLIGPTFTDEEKVKQFIVENDLEDYVSIYGRMQYKDIWQHYATAHVGVCLLHPTPNNLNSHSTKLFEYMAAGLPIIASDFPDFTKMLTEHKCGETSDPYDYERLAEIAENYILDPEGSKITGSNGRKAFDMFYNWEHEGDKLRAIYLNEN